MTHSSAACLAGLIEANLRARDALAAAADEVEDSATESVCRRLSDQLGGHAAELQQLLLAEGRQRLEESTIEKLYSRGWRSSAPEVEGAKGDARLFEVLEGCEEQLRRQYSAALEVIAELQVRKVIELQAADIEFAADMLHALQLRSCSNS